MAAPIVKRVLVALGFGVTTYVGLDLAFAGVRNAVVSSYGGLTAEALQIVSMTGIGQAIGIILGAYTAKLSLIALSHFGKLL
jgi:hypothetical protein